MVQDSYYENDFMESHVQAFIRRTQRDCISVGGVRQIRFLLSLLDNGYSRFQLLFEVEGAKA